MNTHRDLTDDFEDALTESRRDGACGDGVVTGAVPNPFQPLRDRAVAPDVQEARRYVPYYGRKHPLYDPDGFKAELAAYEMFPGQRGTYARFASSARTPDAVTRDMDGRGQGLLMHKYPFPGEPAILPQLRPEEGVRTGSKTRHRHDKAFSTAADLERHLEKEHPGEDIAPDEWHEHENLAKYTMAPRAREEYEHDHTTDARFEGPKARQKLRIHLRKGHGPRTKYKGDDVVGPHTHRRYVAGQHVADRLDIHPWALERLPTAERIYFVLEGTPKADAILSRILDRGENASVFDVPSVTLWRAPELSRTARLWLRGIVGPKPLVVIVYDADGHDNHRVVRQALLCREFLRERGVNACIAAPPADRNERGKLLYKGVDDFLAAGGDLDDLVVLDRDAPFSLSLHAEPDGTIRSTVAGLWPILRCRRSATSAVEALENHIGCGLIEADRPLELEEDEWTGGLRWKGNREEWPTFTVRDDLRYQQQYVRLRDYECPKQPTRVERVLEAMNAALWSDVDRPDAVMPNHQHFAAGIAAAAAAEGVSPGTIRDDPGVRGARDGIRTVFAMYAHMATQKGEMTEAEIALAWGVSNKTVQRVLREPPPAILEEWMKENGMNGAVIRVEHDVRITIVDERAQGVNDRELADAITRWNAETESGAGTDREAA